MSKFKFKVGDKVRVYKDYECKSCMDDVLTVIKVEGGFYQITAVGKKTSPTGELFFERALYKIEEEQMSKYDELKGRIEKVEGWTKEADDILQEIGSNYELVIPVLSKGHTNSIGIVQAPLEGGVIVHYIRTYLFGSQCEKNTAFKSALLWLLDNSDIKKDLVGREVKAEIEGKIYKVKVLSQD